VQASGLHHGVLATEGFFEGGFEDVGLAHEAEVAGVGGVGGAFGIGAVEGIAGDVVEVGHFFPGEGGEGSFEGSVVFVVELAFGGGDPGVGEAAVFDEDDGGGGVGGAELFDEGNGAFGDHVGLHVGEAVDDEDGGVEAGEEVADGGVHFAVAGEAEVNDGVVETAAEDGGVDHAGAGGGGTVGDGSAIEDDRLLGAGSEGFELGVWGHADGEGFDAVVEGEVGGVFAQAGAEVGDESGADCLTGGFGDLDPFPFAAVLFVSGVEVDAADAGGGHVGFADDCGAEGVVDPDGVGVGLEASDHAGAVAAEFPDGSGDFAFGGGGEAVEVAEAFFVRPGAAFDVPGVGADGVPGEGGFFGGSGGFGWGGGLGVEGGGEEEREEGQMVHGGRGTWDLGGFVRVGLEKGVGIGRGGLKGHHAER
jgi:hypothetical protein